jgi:hypothetical protein
VSGPAPPSTRIVATSLIRSISPGNTGSPPPVGVTAAR